MPDEVPYRNFNFVVEIDGIAEVGFAEVEIPDALIDVVEYREGSDKVSSTRKLPGRVRYGDVILRRGVTPNLDLYRWFNDVRAGNLSRRNLVVVLLDAERLPVRRWIVSGAYPVKYTGPDLNAKGNDVVIEEVVLTCEGVEVESD
jgi:phage tail-like protein